MVRTATVEDIAEILLPSLGKAVDLDPEIIETSKYHWLVGGSTGGRYKVEFGYTTAGEAFMNCECEASKFANNCYHAAAVFFRFIEKPDFGKGSFNLEALRELREDVKGQPYLKKTEQKLEKVGNFRI